MVWFKVDDSLAFHAKALMAGNSAMGLWVRAGAWSSAHLTDGFIPGHVALAIGTSAEVEHLVMAGLWLLDEGGYRFHEWTDRNPTADTVKARRDATSARQQRWREHAQQKALETSNVDALRDRLETPTRPDPTRPERSVSRSTSRGDVDRHFTEFWSVFPRKVGKQKARATYERVLRSVSPEVVLAGAIRYRDDPNREQEFTAHPNTWLNRGGWEDEPIPGRGGGRVGATISRSDLLPFEYPDEGD